MDILRHRYLSSGLALLGCFYASCLSWHVAVAEDGLPNIQEDVSVPNASVDIRDSGSTSSVGTQTDSNGTQASFDPGNPAVTQSQIYEFFSSAGLSVGASERDGVQSSTVRQLGARNLSVQFNLSRGGLTSATQVGNDNAAASALVGSPGSAIAQEQYGDNNQSRVGLYGAQGVTVGHLQFGEGQRQSYAVTAKPGTKILIINLPKKKN